MDRKEMRMGGWLVKWKREYQIQPTSHLKREER